MSKETINITLDHFKPKAASGYGWRNNSEEYMKLHFTVEVLDKDGNEIVNKKFRGYGPYPYKHNVDFSYRIDDGLKTFLIEEVRSSTTQPLFEKVIKSLLDSLKQACDDAEIEYWDDSWSELFDQKPIAEIPLNEIEVQNYPTKKDKSLLEDQEIGRSVIKIDAKAGYNWVESGAITEDEYFEIINKNVNRVFTKVETKFLADKGPYIKCTNDNIKQIVKEQIELLGNEADLNHLDVSEVTNMSWMFNRSQFNGDISKWNVGNVMSMWGMFKDSQFNGDISNWDVSNVANMDYMFKDSQFNGDISKWTNNAIGFQQFRIRFDVEKQIKKAIDKYGDKADLNHIDVSQMTDMSHLFEDSQFNGDITNWDVSNVANMDYMFKDSQFNGDISKWDVSSVKSMYEMFSGSQFNGDISSWDVSNVMDMVQMFMESKFNGDISSWDVSNVTKMWGIFDGASNFNQDISGWDVSNVTAMSWMFKDSQFNSDISKWDVSSVKSMKEMFSGSQFNGDISSWDVSNVADMYAMFYNSKFAEDVSGWDIGQVGNVNRMFENCPIPEKNKLKFDPPVESGPYIKCASYNIKRIVEEQIELLGNEADLNHLDVSNVKNMYEMFSGSQFNGDISSWDVSNVTNMGRMFINSKFNGDISSWNVSNVTNMYETFRGSKFNDDISNWDVSNVTNMGSMFSDSQFNVDISSWDVGNVTDMSYMFSDSQFNGDISGWNVSNVTNMNGMFNDCPIPEENKPKFEN